MQGAIGAAVSSDSGATWTWIGLVLEEAWRLASPFVCEHEGDVYMLPDSSEHGDARLYRATEFPHQWKFHGVAADRPLTGAAMVQHNGSFWLFASDTAHMKVGLLCFQHARCLHLLATCICCAQKKPVNSLAGTPPSPCRQSNAKACFSFSLRRRWARGPLIGRIPSERRRTMPVSMLPDALATCVECLLRHSRLR